MDVGYFLELECSFEGGRIVVAAPKVDEVVGVSEYFGEVGNGICLSKHFLDFVRDGLEPLHHADKLVLPDGALQAGKGEGQHGKDGDLSRERLGGCHADFGADVDIGT